MVTGASAGLGAAMSRQLASRGCDLVLVARRGDRLEAVADELRQAHGVEVTCVPLDLTDEAARARLVDDAYAGGDVDILINNAGFGDYGDFGEVTWERHRELLELNVAAVVELTHRFAERMRAGGGERRRHIANVSSVLSWYAVPQFGVYAASRAFVRSFSEAVAVDLRDSNVAVTCVCFGGTYTEFNDVAGIRAGRLYRLTMMRADRAASIAVRGIVRGRRVVVPGVLNRLGAFVTRLVPRRAAGWMMRRLLGRPRPALPEAR